MKTEKKPWYENIGLIIAALFVLFFAGLKVANQPSVPWLTIIIPIVFILFLFAYGFYAGRMENPTLKRGDGKVFRKFDLVIDIASPVRPEESGFLKYELEFGWTIVYGDGFEAKITDPNNITSG